MAEPTSRSAHILVVDDDPRIRQMLIRYFEEEGYHVSAVADGRGMRDALQRNAIDIVLLDLILDSGEDGLMLAREIRSRSDVPIIMLTGRDDVVDRIVGLEMGADDYLAKPCNPRELLARIRTVLRRRGGKAAGQDGSEPASAEERRFSGWRMHMGVRTLHNPAGEHVPLSDSEFRLLRAFVEHPRRVLTRDQLLDYSGGADNEVYDRAIDVQVSRLRRKLGAGGGQDLIRTVRNEGYMFFPVVE